jgi:hypothetical protein
MAKRSAPPKRGAPAAKFRPGKPAFKPQAKSGLLKGMKPSGKMMKGARDNL